MEGFQHLEVCVVHPVKQYGVYVFKNYMLFYQRFYLLNNFCAKLQKAFDITLLLSIFVLQNDFF